MDRKPKLIELSTINYAKNISLENKKTVKIKTKMEKLEKEKDKSYFINTYNVTWNSFFCLLIAAIIFLFTCLFIFVIGLRLTYTYTNDLGENFSLQLIIRNFAKLLKTNVSLEHTSTNSLPLSLNSNHPLWTTSYMILILIVTFFIITIIYFIKNVLAYFIKWTNKKKRFINDIFGKIILLVLIINNIALLTFFILLNKQIKTEIHFSNVKINFLSLVYFCITGIITPLIAIMLTHDNKLYKSIK